VGDSMEIVVERLDPGPEVVRALERCLSDAERHRASRFVFDRDRHRFVVALARLRELLAAILGVRPESIELVYGTHGRPALAGRFADSDLRLPLRCGRFPDDWQLERVLCEGVSLLDTTPFHLDDN
jgi:4'-phosphopantetheinyl transferase family protien